MDPQPGQYYFAKMKGYPPWPAIICEVDMLPRILLEKRPVGAIQPDGTFREDFKKGGKKAEQRLYPIMFLATNEL